MFRRKKAAVEVTVEITASEAQRQSQDALAEAKSRWPAVRQVTASLKGSREDNHFSERVMGTFREKKA